MHNPHTQDSLKNTHQQEQKRDLRFSCTQAFSLRLQNDQEDGPRASEQPSLSIILFEQLRRSPPDVPCRHATALWSWHTPCGGRGHVWGHQGERTLPTHPQGTLLCFAFTYTAPPSQLPWCAPERQQIHDILHYFFCSARKNSSSSMLL